MLALEPAANGSSVDCGMTNRIYADRWNRLRIYQVVEHHFAVPHLRWVPMSESIAAALNTHKLFQAANRSVRSTTAFA